ncbi:uncharacterized protein [Rutidosis leptorrhynchoides]|uniref:uncharacterized protein n=1 Tax=Rutidosis leptorrhynchoides TaxID=125765 RepID=UPI003A9937FE
MLVSDLNSCTLAPDKQDSWRWQGVNNGVSTTKRLTHLIDSKLLNVGSNMVETLRNNFVPKKVELFIWRSRKKRIPTLIELDKRGIDLHSVRCPLCDDGVESFDHALLFCKKVFDIWEKIFKWWGFNVFSSASLCEIFQDSTIENMSDLGSKIWQAVLWSCCYLIWWNRNQVVFNKKGWTTLVALCEIQLKAFEWIGKRSKSLHLDWHTWLHNPQSSVM